MVKIAAIVLAAGTSSRFRQAGGTQPTKLVAQVAGKSLVRSVVEAALKSQASSVIVVTGHAENAIVAELADCAVTIVHNRQYLSGLASSLRTGIAALDEDTVAAVILLADMPYVKTALIDRLIEEFNKFQQAIAVVPVFAGERGNPVLLARDLFDQIALLRGDEGARRLLGKAAPVYEIDGDETIATDFDTPTDWPSR
jgi:molybdenum cofactor cytidylyltransferase